MMDLLKYLLLVAVSALAVGAFNALWSITVCLATGMSGYCRDLLQTAGMAFLITACVALGGVLLIGLPLFLMLRKDDMVTFGRLVFWPAAVFALVIFVLFEVHRQNAYLTFALFSLSWLVAAATFWYVANWLELSSRSRSLPTAGDDKRYSTDRNCRRYSSHRS